MHKILTSILFGLMILTLAGAALAETSPDAGTVLPTAAAPAVQAQETPSTAAAESLNLKSLFTQAYQSSPRIKSARAMWDAAVAEYPQAKSWPDPTAQFKWFPGTGSSEVELMQMIPNPRRTSLAGGIAQKRAEIAHVAFEKAVRDTLVDIMNSYYQLGYLDRAIAIASANKDLFQQIVDLANVQFSQGKLGASEKSIAESRLAQSGYELQLLQEQLFSEQANMRNLLGVAPDTVIDSVYFGTTDIKDLNLDDLRAQMKEYRQELSMAGLSVDSASLNVALSKSLALPDFSAGLMYERMVTMPTADTTGDMNDPMAASTVDNNIAFIVGLTIPIWGGKNHARVDQAQSLLEAAQAERDRQVNQATADIDRIYWQLQNQGRLIALYRDTLIPQANQAADLAQTFYESGTNSFTDLIESRLVLENFQLAGARAEADYLISLAELQRAIGAPVTEVSE